MYELQQMWTELDIRRQQQMAAFLVPTPHYVQLLNSTPMIAHNSSRESLHQPSILNRSLEHNSHATLENSYDHKSLKRRADDDREDDQPSKCSKITYSIPMMYDGGVVATVGGLKKKRSLSIEEEEKPQFLRKLCVTPPVNRSNHTETEPCSP